MKRERKLKSRTVNFRMTDEELDGLDRIAKIEDRSRSQVLRRLVLEGLHRHLPSTCVVNA